MQVGVRLEPLSSDVKVLIDILSQLASDVRRMSDERSEHLGPVVALSLCSLGDTNDVVRVDLDDVSSEALLAQLFALQLSFSRRSTLS